MPLYTVGIHTDLLGQVDDSSKHTYPLSTYLLMRVLISGISVAGPTVAIPLAKDDARVTLVEKPIVTEQ